MDMNIIISPGTSMDVLYGILNALSDNNADKKATEKVNGCIKALIDTLNKKGFDTSSRYSNLLEKLPKDKIQEEHIKVINKLIGELILFYETPKIKLTFDGKNTKKQKTKKNKSKISDWDASKVDNKFISTYMRFIENVTRPDFTPKYSSDAKKELSDTVLNLLDIQEFQNQIFIDDNIGTTEDKAIASYVATLVNISNSNLLQCISDTNQDKYFKILKLLLENNNLSKKVFNEGNIGKNGPIRLYLTALSNSAALIVKKIVTQKKINPITKKSIKQNTNVTQPIQIRNNNIRFLIQALKRFVTDQTLNKLIFDVNNNFDRNDFKDINMFWGVIKNITSNIIYLENSEIDDLLQTLNILLEQCKDLCINQGCYDLLLHGFTDILSHCNSLTNGQKEVLSIMINTKLLGDTWIKKILQDTKSRKQYFTFLINIIKNSSDLIDSKFLINVMYNFSKDENIQQIYDQNIDVKICLFVLEDAIKQYIGVEDKDLNLTFKKIVCILNNVQNKDYKFKEQIFYKNEIDEPINENAKDTSTKIMFDNEISKHKNSIARLYTGMLKNVAQLFNNKNINIQHKQAFFSLICDILIKKEHEDIRKMIFSENEIGEQGAIYNFNQAFSNLLSVDNLNNLYTNDKKMYVELLLTFICDENLNKQIYTLANNDQIKKDDIQQYKSAITRFYTGILKNVAQLFNNKNIDIQHKQAFFSLICDILIKKEHEDIRKMIFSENEIGEQGAIYNFNQAFSNLLSVDNLNNLYTNDKKMYVELLLTFICDENLNKQIYTLANNDQIKKDDIQQYKSAITRFYTGMLKNVAKLSGEVNIDDQYKLQFCKLGQNIIKETKISEMIFSGNENGPQGAICDLMQMLFHVLKTDNLKMLSKSDRNSLIQTFLLFVRDNELQAKIFHSANAGENGAISCCLKILVHLLHSDMEQFKDKDKTAIQNLLTNLKQNCSKANMNLNKYAEFNQIKNILDLNKKQNEKQLSKFKSIKYIFRTEKKLEKSNSSSELLLSSEISKSKNTPIRTNNNVQKLKISNSIGNFFQINQKTGNKQLNLNLNTFKPKANTTQIKIGKAVSKQNTLPKLCDSSEIQNKIGKNEFE